MITPQIFPAPSAIAGEIRAFVGSLPFGWLECDGSAFDAAKYPRLKTVLGAATLPDLRDASLRGATASAAANTKSGSNNPAVPVPAHSHSTEMLNMDSIAVSGTECGGGLVTSSGKAKFEIKGRNGVVGATLPSSISGVDGATLDVRGSSYYVKFAIYAL